MAIESKDRTTLKTYFEKNKVPKASEFADLIDGMLNQKDDGIFKKNGGPLCIAAEGDATGEQRLINFYGNPNDSAPAWTLQLNPPPANGERANAGFSISDSLGKSRLFIDVQGNIGIGTINPAGRLDVANLVRFGLDEGSSGNRSISFARDSDDEHNAGKITYKGGFGGNALHITGAGSAASGGRKIILYDNVQVWGTLQVNGGINSKDGWSIIQTDKTDWLRINPDSQYPAIALYKPVTIGAGGLSIGDWSQQSEGNLKVTGVTTLSASNTPLVKDGYGVPTTTTGIRFPDNPGGGGYDTAWIQYYVRSGEACTLEIGIANDGDDHIALIPSGGVGIGTTTPKAKLHVEGGIISSMWNVKQVLYNHGGLTYKTFDSKGGTLLIFASGSAYSTANSKLIGVELILNGKSIGTMQTFSNQENTHRVFSPIQLVCTVPAGTHTLSFNEFEYTATDGNDYFNVTVLELPFLVPDPLPA